MKKGTCDFLIMKPSETFGVEVKENDYIVIALDSAFVTAYQTKKGYNKSFVVFADMGRMDVYINGNVMNGVMAKNTIGKHSMETPFTKALSKLSVRVEEDKIVVRLSDKTKELYVECEVSNSIIEDLLFEEVRVTRTYFKTAKIKVPRGTSATQVKLNYANEIDNRLKDVKFYDSVAMQDEIARVME